LSSKIVSFSVQKQLRSASNKLALTEQRIADLKAVGRTIYFNDARMPGLSVRVTKAGVKSYVFTKKVNGRFLRITLGKTASMSLSAARSAASAHHGDIAKGVDIAAARRSAKAAAGVKAMTLAEAYERFLTLKDRRPSTKNDYNRLWRLHLPEHLKRKLLADVTPSDVERLKARLGSKTPRTANKIIVLLSAIMSKSGRWADNPARGVERFEERVRTRRLNAEELARRWTSLPEAHGRTFSRY